MNNIELFELSRANSSLNFDFSNPKGVLVIPTRKEEENELTKANHKLMEYITAYKIVKNVKTIPKEYKESLIYDIMNIIDNTKYINYSSFCIYFQVLRFSWSTFKDAKKTGILSKKERAELLKNAVELYIENRHNMYLSHGYSDIVLQVQSDCSSSRRSAQIGTNNLERIMKSYDIKFATNYNDFMSSNSYFFPEDNVSLLKEILDNNNIDFEFRKSRDNKNPDLMFKISNQFYILEHKLASGNGGGQNMEINEIITFIGQNESNSNVHYISCLEGDILRKLSSTKVDPKTKTQHDNIITNLKNHPNNYFVNEFGLEEILKLQIK